MSLIMRSTNEIKSLKDFFVGFEDEKKSYNLKLLINLVYEYCIEINPNGSSIILKDKNSISLDFNGFSIATFSRHNAEIVVSKRDLNSILMKELTPGKHENSFYPNTLSAYSFDYEIVKEYGNDIVSSLKGTALNLIDYRNDNDEIKSVFQNINYLFEQEPSTNSQVRENLELEEIGLEQLISSEESEIIEFKQSLSWESDKADNVSFNILCKEVIAFLNSYGGYLIYGIKDSGELVGIQKDIEKHGNSYDKLELSVRDILEYSIGKVLSTRIRIYFEKVDNKTILILKVPPSSKPVYGNLKFEICKKHKHTGGPCSNCVQQRVVVADHTSTQGFFVRNGNRANQLNIEEMLTYIKTHWPEFVSN